MDSVLKQIKLQSPLRSWQPQTVPGSVQISLVPGILALELFQLTVIIYRKMSQHTLVNTTSCHKNEKWVSTQAEEW